MSEQTIAAGKETKFGRAVRRIAGRIAERRVTLARWLTVLGVVTLVVCVLAVAFEPLLPLWVKEFTGQAETPASSDCKKDLAAALTPPNNGTKLATDDADGKLRIVSASPGIVRLGGKLCLVVAGVGSKAGLDKSKAVVDAKEEEVQKAQKLFDDAAPEKKAELEKKLNAAKAALADAKSAQNQKPLTDVHLFLNGRRAPLSLKVPANPAPQLITYEFGQTPDAATDDAKFWRNLLGSKTQYGLMPLQVGVSRSQSNLAEFDYDKTAIQFRVYWPRIVWIGALSMLLLFIAFAIFASKSAILRDHALTNQQLAEQDVRIAKEAAAKDAQLAPEVGPAEEKAKKLKDSPEANFAAGTYSLGRTQMALWLGLSVAGFIFLWLTLGYYRNVITEAVLILLGINSLTGLTAVILDKEDPEGPAPKAKSKGFWSDLSSDNEGAKLQRIQMMIWTGILAAIFVWNVVANFIFVEFDAYLLLLMGVVNSTYLGFKAQETAGTKAQKATRPPG